MSYPFCSRVYAKFDIARRIDALLHAKQLLLLLLELVVLAKLE